MTLLKDVPCTLTLEDQRRLGRFVRVGYEYVRVLFSPDGLAFASFVVETLRSRHRAYRYSCLDGHVSTYARS